MNEKPDPNVFDSSQRDYYAHPLNSYGRCAYLQAGGQCPPPVGIQSAFLLQQSYEYLSGYAVNVVGINIPPLVTTVPLLVPLILTGLGL
jgi:hypothetical protein